MHTWGRSVFKGLFNMAGKEFKTIDEQINILEVRGLNFPDKSVARSFCNILFKTSYYNIDFFRRLLISTLADGLIGPKQYFCFGFFCS